MIAASRPIRFLALTIAGWIGVRTIALWPVAEALPDLVRAIAPPAVATAAPPSVAPSFAAGSAPHASGNSIADLSVASPREPSVLGVTKADARALKPLWTAPTIADPVSFHATSPTAMPGSGAPPVFTGSRLSASAWAIVRPDGPATPFASQLGGSQAGARLAYAIDQARRLAVTARLSTALDTRQREAAVGFDWKPTRLPIHLVLEQRIGIDGSRGGPGIGAIGGVGPTPVGARFRLEAYGQGGVIARNGTEGFADGSIRISRPLANRGRTTLDLGVGSWGGAQRGAARLDIGPSVGASISVGRRSLRMTADWRQRIAGDARPDSGPALSIGTDF